jgi:Na+-driven multidrug efflux pump
MGKKIGETEEQNLKKSSYIASRQFMSYLLPTVLSLVANSMNSLIDTAIVGNCIPGTGLAAMSVVAPAHLIYFTVGSTISVGSSICFSRSVGEGERMKARRFFGYAIRSIVITGLLLTLLLFPQSRNVAVFFGAKGDLIDPAADYLRYYFLGGIFAMLLYIPLNFSRVLGKPNVPVVLLGIMGGLNIVLTWTFVAVLKTGTGGASLATVISMAVAFAVGCLFIFEKGGKMNPVFSPVGFRSALTVLLSGSAAGLNNFARFLMIFGLNRVIVLYGQSGMLSTYSIARSVQELLNCLVLGTAQTIMPLVAMYGGERNNDSIRTVMKEALKKGTAAVLVCALLFSVFTVPLTGLFGAAGSRENSFAIICACMSLVPALTNNVLSGCYASSKKYWLSQMILVLRVLFTVGTAFLLIRTAGQDMLWLCFAAAEICIFLVLYPVTKAFGKKKSLEGILLLNPKDDAPENILDFSVQAKESEVVFASGKISEFLEEKGLPSAVCMKAGLAIEELLMAVMNEKFLGEDQFVDIRVVNDPDGTVMRFRYGGKKNNPFEISEDIGIEDNSYGVNLIKKATRETEYSWVFGLNNLVVII